MSKERRMVKMYSGNGSPLIAEKQGRNDLCACGSGKKAKKCHGCETRWRHSKVSERVKAEDVEQVKKELEAKMNETEII